jgi:hypothetical protein
MWYLPIECDNTVKRPLVCDYSNFEEFGFNETDFKSGKEITDWPESIVFRATEVRYDGTPDDALQNSFMIPVFSQKLKEIMERGLVRRIQYLPVNVQGVYGNAFPGFYIANILSVIEAFDYGNSQYSIFPDDFPNPNVRGRIAGVRKFVLRSSELSGDEIFRLAEYKRRFFVNETVKNLFTDNKFSGYSFIQVDALP